QMFIAPLAVWAGAVFGTRRVLLAACVVFAVASAAIPFSQTLGEILAPHVLGGLGSGCLVPLTIAFVVLSLPPRYWAAGIAAYALNLETSLNISASVEGLYVDHDRWAWIFWQYVPITAVMAVCVYFGVPSQPVD